MMRSDEIVWAQVWRNWRPTPTVTTRVAAAAVLFSAGAFRACACARAWPSHIIDSILKRGKMHMQRSCIRLTRRIKITPTGTGTETGHNSGFKLVPLCSRNEPGPAPLYTRLPLSLSPSAIRLVRVRVRVRRTRTTPQ